MGLQKLFERIADDREPRGAMDSLIQRAASLAAPFYGVGAAIDRFRHENGMGERRSLSATVFSVGNLTVGGTGKTPFTVWLVRWLKENGKRPAILTRGYGREDEDRLVVVHDGRRLRSTTRDAGDEPVLLAESLQDVPVIACANRYRAGSLALKKFTTDMLVLDDGFQHHRLARVGDIVLIDSTKLLSELKLFPRGTLRESPGVLSRAHLIVLTRCNQAKDLRKVWREVRAAAPSVPIVRMNLESDGLHTLTGEPFEPAGKTAILLCGVANPESVRKSAEAEGIKIRKVIALPDHARIDARLLKKTERLRRRLKADLILTTEKDAVKIRETAPSDLPIATLRVHVTPASEKDAALLDKVLKARLHAKLVRGFLGK